MSAGANPLVMSGLRVELSDGTVVVDGIDLTIRPGRILGLVGESGSGKTTTALSIFGHATRGLHMTAGSIEVDGVVVQGVGATSARGPVSYVPQNPGTALNPSLRVGLAVQDLLSAQTGDPDDRVARLLESVGLPGSRVFARRFPHQLSGGQQQRVCIAGSLASQPTLVVLDEPTTGLDVITQERILQELVRLRDDEQLAMLYITHDLAVAAQIADDIAVMYAGEVVEYGSAAEVLARPRHPYTRGLMASTPDHLDPPVLEAMPGMALGLGEREAGCAFRTRCPQAVAGCAVTRPAMVESAPGHQVRCTEWTRTPTSVRRAAARVSLTPAITGDAARAEPLLSVQDLRAVHLSRAGTVVAAQNISFDVDRGSCVALVGESGSGKTTIARVIAGLHPVSSGVLRLSGEVLPGRAQRRTMEHRRVIQIVFQNPAEALNPRYSVGDAIARPIEQLRGLGGREATAEVSRLLDAVRLPARMAARYPGQLSGGERQRVAIARALGAEPELIVCDEVTSALDVSVQAVILNLLRELREDLGLSLLFITHDLGVVAEVASEVLVLNAGEVCERGPTRDVLERPSDPYTRSLLEAAPSLSRVLGQLGSQSSSVALP